MTLAQQLNGEISPTPILPPILAAVKSKYLHTTLTNNSFHCVQASSKAVAYQRIRHRKLGYILDTLTICFDSGVRWTVETSNNVVRETNRSGNLFYGYAAFDLKTEGDIRLFERWLEANRT